MPKRAVPAKVELERGSFDWSQGAGYQTPSPRSGGAAPQYPPGWFDEPGGTSTPIPAIVVAQGEPAKGPPLGREGALEQRPVEPAPPEDRMSAREFSGKVELNPDRIAQMVVQAVRGAVGDEFVSISNGTAIVMGHELKLSPDGIAAIKALLAMEVCKSLEQEKERVLGTLLSAGMQPDSGAGRPDMPGVPGTKGAVVSSKSRRSRKVQRVRKQGANSRAEDVPEVQSAQESEARDRTA